MREKHGFIYIWRDRKHNRFYVGSHWGTEDDGYVCSSSWMMQAYKKRPGDFKRKIIERFQDRSKINEIEHRWLQMIKPEELKGNRYYNHCNFRFGHWSTNEDSRKSIAEKIGGTSRGRVWTEEQKAKLLGRTAWNKGKTGYRVSVREDDPRKGKPTWNKGKKTGPLSEEHRAKISAGISGNPDCGWNRGKKATPETREKMSRTRRGMKFTDSHRAAMAAAKTGKTHTEETKLKISIRKVGSTPWNKGKRASEESRFKMSIAARGRTPWNKKATVESVAV